MAVKKISKDLEQEIITLYKTGLSMANVGKNYKISAATVMRILERNRVPRRTKGGIYKLPEFEIVQRYRKGESCQNIADSSSVSFNTVSSILKK